MNEENIIPGGLYFVTAKNYRRAKIDFDPNGESYWTGSLFSVNRQIVAKNDFCIVVATTIEKSPVSYVIGLDGMGWLLDCFLSKDPLDD